MAAKAPALLHKSVSVAIDPDKIDDETGIVEAFVSGIGNKDSGGDIIIPGAFDQFLPKRKPKGVWSHDWDRPVSKTLEIYEVPAGDPRLPMKMQLAGIGGLYVKTQFNLKTTEGREAFENVKFFGDEAEWSIGYQVHDQEYDKTQKAMILKVIELYEYSPVLFGMNALTSTVSVKAQMGENGECEVEIEGLDEVQTKAVKAALEVILKESSTDIDTEAQEADNMSKKNEATGLYDIELPDGSVKSFFTEEKADKFLADCQEYADAEKAAAEVETKVVAGSYEERSRAIREAIKEAVGKNAWAWPVATFESSVVFELEDYGNGTFGYFQCEYSFDDEGEVKLGEASEVELVEVIVAKTAFVEAMKAGMLDAVKDALADTEGLDDFAVKTIIEKAGRVLSKDNRSALEKASEAIQAVLDADAAPEASTDEKSIEEKALEEVEAQEAAGVISPEAAELIKSALAAKVAAEAEDDEFEGWTEDDFTAVKAWAEAVELAELEGLSEEDVKSVEEWAEAVKAEAAETETKDADTEGEEDLSELEGLSEDDLTAVKEWAEALAEKADDDDEGESEKSVEASIASDLKELADIASLLGD